MINKKSIFGIISLVIVIILLIIALTGTWWKIAREGIYEKEYQKSTGNYKLMEVEGVDEASGRILRSKVAKYDTLRNNPAYDDMIKVYDITLCLMISSLVFAIISLVTLLLVSIKIVVPKIAAIFLIIAMIFAAVAPIYFATALPIAIDKDTKDMGGFTPVDSFMGSKDVNGIATSWGPCYAWYLSIVAFIFTIVTLVATVFVEKPLCMRVKRGGKKREEKIEGVAPEEVRPINVQCPYCQSTFQITPAKRPFKVKCPSCGKKSMLR